MKRIGMLSLFALVFMTGCGDNTGSCISGSQNSVEDILLVAAEQTTEAAEEIITEDIAEESSEADTTENLTEVLTETTADETQTKTGADNEIVDLSDMNANMVYAEVFAMMTSPEEYLGKTIIMTGICNRYTDINTGEDYYACIIQDATACCAQGIEFRLPEGEAYPEMGTEITVTGTFGSYTQGGTEFYALLHSRLK